MNIAARQIISPCTAGMPPVVTTVFVLYLLSYAPMVRLTGQCPENLESVYAPADWLMNHTGLHDPILAWADAWEVRDWFEAPCWFQKLTMSKEARAIERKLGIED
jgi:hypothetical protein